MRRAFTLIELLVVVAIIALLVAILVPSLNGARQQARAATCLANLHMLGVGIAIYGNENRDVLPPGRLPRIDNCNAYAIIRGGRKYRPTFVATMSASVNAAPFDDPQACRGTVDRFGEPGDQQDFSCGVYLCPASSDWTDERNAGYGYNYQFMGNSRIRTTTDPTSYKNWPVRATTVRDTARSVAAGDCLGTAATFPKNERVAYVGNGRDEHGFGNEGFNLDPPRIDLANGEAAGFDSSPQTRTGLDPRHRGRGSVLWIDAHASHQTVEEMGYKVGPLGEYLWDGDNSAWSGGRGDMAWTPALSR